MICTQYKCHTDTHCERGAGEMNHVASSDEFFIFQNGYLIITIILLLLKLAKPVKV